MEVFLGTVMGWAPNFAPRGWAFCNGQIMSIAQNSALFALLGTTYGGDGQSTFALPNLQSRVIVGAGQGPGLSPYALGQTAGSENVTLLSTEIPAHVHSGEVTNIPVKVSSGNSDASAASAGASIATPGTLAGRDFTASLGFNSVAPDVTLNAASAGPAQFTTGPAGGNQAHSNIQPYLTLNYIIAIEGIFPSRN